jgi:excinuclease ABC subunit C
VTAMDELKQALSLPSPPSRIEGYDISHTQGQLTVGSMVVFVQGVPYKQDYRRFNIRTVYNDDYGAMREVLTRRFERYRESTAGELIDVSQIGQKKETAWALLPDLLLIDGGKGQLGVALEVLAEFDLIDDVPVASLAKQEEVLFMPGRDQPIRLPSRSDGFYLVQRVRDESHRFANEGHRRRRSKVGTASILDSVPGVGPQRRKRLLEHFGSLDELRKATAEEIASVPGIPYEVGVAVKSHLT